MADSPRGFAPSSQTPVCVARGRRIGQEAEGAGFDPGWNVHPVQRVRRSRAAALARATLTVAAMALLAASTVSPGARKTSRTTRRRSPATTARVAARCRGSTRSWSRRRGRTPLSDLPQTVTVISREDIEESKVDTVADLLRQVAGVEVVQSGGRGTSASAFIRGSESTRCWC
jgi:outer membrane cobalamin receptor